jgi:nucleoid DNA-binding protein
MTMNDKARVTKKQFLADVAQEVDMPVDVVTKVFNACVDRTKNIVADGSTLTITGFGSFYLQRHKGHPVQFEGHGEVPDYVVFKFSASDVLNRRFRELDAEGDVAVE